MRKAKLSFDLCAQQHGNDGLSTGAQKPEHLSQTTMCMRISSKNNIVRRLNRSISRTPPSPQANGFGFARFYRHPRVRHPPAKAGLKGVHRQDFRRHAAHQDKAVTPTSLKDIFTPIWAEP